MPWVASASTATSSPAVLRIFELPSIRAVIQPPADIPAQNASMQRSASGASSRHRPTLAVMYGTAILAIVMAVIVRTVTVASLAMSFGVKFAGSKPVFAPSSIMPVTPSTTRETVITRWA